MKQKPANTTFLNVDLDVYSSTGLDALVKTLPSALMVISRNKGRVSFELSGVQPQSPEKAIKQIVHVVQSLPPSVKKLWKRCHRKSLNIGIQAGRQPREACFALSTKALKLATSIDADIVFTVYSS